MGAGKDRNFRNANAMFRFYAVFKNKRREP